MVNGEEPPAVDAVPLRPATPAGPDQPGGGRPPAPADAAPSSDPASPAAGAAGPATPAAVHDEPGSPPPAGGSPPSAGGGPDSGQPASGGPDSGQPAGGAPPAPPAASAPPAPPNQPAAPARHRRTLAGRGAHALRRVPPPQRIAVNAVRQAGTWARRPAGRLALIGLFIAALIGLTGAAGAYLVPASAPVSSARPAAQDSSAPQVDASSADVSGPTTAPSAGPALSQSAAPLPSSSIGGPVGAAGARPADALAGWAQHMATRVDIPLVALQAYGYAELVAAQTTPGCHLSWTTLAAIGKVESNHGNSNGATLYPDGQAMPAIVGLPLDGKGGRQPVSDTDGGQLDHDITWDHAVGPMQFIPSTWRAQAVDADNDGIRNPNDIDDAALAAANYLCSNGRDLATADGWRSAVAAYNVPESYRQLVFNAANDYGTRSRT